MSIFLPACQFERTCISSSPCIKGKLNILLTSHWAIDLFWRRMSNSTGRQRVAVIGAGPSGLCCLKVRNRFSLWNYLKIFVPDSIRLWNLLKAEAREAISIKSFRKNISVEIVNPPSYYAFGKRFINIIHTKLRHKCILHYDHYKHSILFMRAKRRCIIIIFSCM